MKITTCAVRLLSLTLVHAGVFRPGSTRQLISSQREDEYTVAGKRYVLEERDYVLAEKHGVDLNEMRKHSVVERDGEEFTFWVNKAFSADEEVMIARRHNSSDNPGEPTHTLASARKAKEQTKRGIDIATDQYRPQFTPNPDKYWFCNEALDVVNITTEQSPTHKTMVEILNWAKSNPGYFLFLSQCCKKPVTVLIAGSTDDTNAAALRAKQHDMDLSYDFRLGTRDIQQVVKTSIVEVNKNYNTSWPLVGTKMKPDFKMATRGGLRCLTKTPGIRFPENPWVEWELSSFKNISKSGVAYRPGYSKGNATIMLSVLTPLSTPQSVKTADSSATSPGRKVNGTAELKTPGSTATPFPQTTESAVRAVKLPGSKTNETTTLSASS